LARVPHGSDAVTHGKVWLGHGDDDVCVSVDAVVVWLGWGRVGVELWGDVLVLVGGASLLAAKCHHG
jgi:hypothetical protein